MNDLVIEDFVEEKKVEFRIPTDNFAKFCSKIESLSRRVAKQGFAPINFEVIGTENAATEINGRVVEYVVKIVRLDAPVAKISGWTFVSRIDHENGVNIINNVPNATRTTPVRFRDAGPNCDHCGLDRKRNATFILCEDATGDYKQIGASCIVDFIGHDAAKTARLAEYLTDADELGNSFSCYTPRLYELDEYLAHVAAFIEAYGYVSNTVAYNSGRPSTSTLALTNIEPHPSLKPLPVTDEHKAQAVAALEWAAGIEAVEDDYLYNIQRIAALGAVTAKHLGYAASIISAHRRYLKTVRTESPTKLPSNHVGTVGEKIEAKVLVVGHTVIDGYYGITHLYRFQTVDGNVLVWFASRGQNIAEGSELTLRGTVKEHSEWQGTKQTALTRCKIV